MNREAVIGMLETSMHRRRALMAARQLELILRKAVDDADGDERHDLRDWTADLARRIRELEARM